MSEIQKTGIFLGTAVAVGLLAFATIPRQVNSRDEIQDQVGQKLFEKFDDPEQVAHLKILKYNEALGSLQKFELSRDANGLWIIPSHDSYPADAASQVSRVANAFVGLKALTVAGRVASDHDDFGVVEPEESGDLIGKTGVGIFVSMENQKGEPLVNLVIGKEVRDNSKQRFVRKTGSDPVFTAEIDPTILNTDFSSWIEGDLLKLSSTDVANLILRDYNIIEDANGRNLLKKNFDADLMYNGEEGVWKAKSIAVYDKREPTPRLLADDEEINQVKLNEIKNALDSLKIVGVKRKPKGLAADLKANNELLDDNESMRSLARRGFMAASGPEGNLEIVSANGELLVGLKDGVEYVLRFGASTIGESSEGEGKKEAEKSDDEKKDNLAIKRTLFVTARLNEAMYPMPTLQSLPETIEQMKEIEAKEQKAKEEAEAAEKAAAAESDGKEPSSPTSDDASNSDSETPVEPAKDAKSPEAKIETSVDDKTKPDQAEVIKGGDPKNAQPADKSALDSNQPGAAAKPSKSDSTKAESADQSLNRNDTKVRFVSIQSDETKQSATKTPDSKDVTVEESKAATSSKPVAEVDKLSSSANAPADDTSKNEPATAKTESAKAEDGTAKSSAETPEELKERLDALRERITKENTRLLDDRKDRMDKAKKKAAELNARFADWYYEISDSEFGKLRASLDDLIKKKAPSNSESDK